MDDSDRYDHQPNPRQGYVQRPGQPAPVLTPKDHLAEARRFLEGILSRQDARGIRRVTPDTDPERAAPEYETASPRTLQPGDLVWFDESAAWYTVRNLEDDPPPGTVGVFIVGHEPDEAPYRFAADALMYMVRRVA